MASEGDNTKDLLKDIRRNSAKYFHDQLTRAKRQNWWTFSKMVMVFSVGLMAVATVGFILVIAVEEAGQYDRELILFIISLLVGLGGTPVYLVSAALLAGIGSGVAIATGQEEVLHIRNKYLRVIVHVTKLVAAGVLVWALGQNTEASFIESVLAIIAVTGVLLLPFGLVLWGCLGLWNERHLW